MSSTAAVDHVHALTCYWPFYEAEASRNIEELRRLVRTVGCACTDPLHGAPLYVLHVAARLQHVDLLRTLLTLQGSKTLPACRCECRRIDISLVHSVYPEKEEDVGDSVFKVTETFTPRHHEPQACGCERGVGVGVGMLKSSPLQLQTTSLSLPQTPNDQQIGVGARSDWAGLGGGGGPPEEMSQAVVGDSFSYNGIPYVDCRDDKGRTPLHCAAEVGGVEVVRVLAWEFGADVNARDGKGLTPLHKAVESACVPLVRLLCGAALGADITARTNDGKTVLHLALRSYAHDTALLSELTRCGAGACRDVGDVTGRTSLHFAVQRGDTEYIRFLTRDLSADVNVCDEDGRTPLHFAAMGGKSSGRSELITLLIDELGAQVECKDREGVTPLHLAARSDHSSMVARLVAHGADANMRDQQGRTPLFFAVEEGNVHAVRSLIARGADVKAKDRQGNGVLFHAKKESSSYSQIVRALEASKDGATEAKPRTSMSTSSDGDSSGDGFFSRLAIFMCCCNRA